MSISQNFPDEGPTLNLNFAGSKVLDPRITFSRSSVGTYMDANGLVVTGSADEPRFDHRYVNGEVESLGLLVEEQRTNLMPRSQDFSASPGGWTLSTGASRTQNLIGPDGVTNSAWTITDSNNTGDLAQFYKQISISASSSTKYCISCFMKDVDNAGITPDLYTFFSGNSTKGSYVRYTFSTDSFTAHAADGGGIQPSIYGSIPYPNGWVRLYFVVDDSNDGSNTTLQFRIYPNTRNANATGSMGFFGVQIEIGAFPTSYIPALGSQTVTRVHDRAYYENVDQTDWFSKTEGTVVFEHTDVPYNSSTSTGWPAVGFGETAGGGSNPSIQYFITKDYGAAQYLVRRFHPNGDSASISTGGTGSGAPASKVGFVYKEDDYALVRNGSLVGTDSSGAVPSAYMLILGMNAISNTGNNWNAHLKNLQYYPTRLSNTVLQNLTK